MKKNNKRPLGLLVAFAMAFAGFPAISFAVDGEPVLVDIDWSGQNSSSISGTDIAVEVPYTYGTSFDAGKPSHYEVNAGLNPDKGALYTGVTLSGGTIMLSTEAGIAGSQAITANYTHNVTSGSAINSATIYTVTVSRAARQNPDFGGNLNIKKAFAAGYTFTASDFTKYYDANDGAALEAISISGGSAEVTLLYNETPYVAGDLIPMSDIREGRLRVQARAAGTAKYTVSAYEAGNALTAYGGVCVNVAMLADNIIETIFAGELFQLSPTPLALPKIDMNAKFTTKVGASIEHVTFTLPSASQGVLYENYPLSTVQAGRGYTLTSLGNVVFVPNREYSGTVNVAYKAYDENGNEFTGILTIKVKAEAYSVAAQAVTVKQTETLLLKNTNIAAAFGTAAGAALSSIKFILPDAAQGTLYKSYVSSSNLGTAVVQGAEYSLTDYNAISFVPKAPYIGTSIIYYTGKDAGGNSFNGKLTITIKVASLAEIITSVAQDEVLILPSSTFSTKFKEAAGGDFSYVQFTLPSPSYGVLYYNYSSSSNPGTAVKATDKYYRTGTGRQLGEVVFVPKSTYTGTLIVNYSGYTASGEMYPGTMKVTVTASSSDIATLSYSIDQGSTLLLSTTDISNAFKAEVRSNLSYVKFTLPSSAYGVLYYNYTSTGSYDAKVSASTKYYSSKDAGVHLLSLVSFVPKSTYKGTFVIDYVAYDSRNNDYIGKIQVNVKSGEVTIRPLSYSIDQGELLTFSGADFNDKFKDASSGASFSYIQFILPSSTYGTLYYDYTSVTKPGTAVRAVDKYYRTGSSNKLFGHVSFVPKTTYAGTFELKYVAYDSDDNAYGGIVKMAVIAQDILDSQYFNDVQNHWAAKSIDYLYKKGTVKGTTARSYNPKANITRGDFILMLYRAFGLKGTALSNFSDVPKGSYYYDAIAVAKALGIAQGDSGGKYRPLDQLTRQDAVVLLNRTMAAVGQSLVGNTSQLSKFSDKRSISAYAQVAVAALVAKGVIDGYPNGTFEPLGNMTRAEMASVLYKVDTL